MSWGSGGVAGVGRGRGVERVGMRVGLGWLLEGLVAVRVIWHAGLVGLLEDPVVSGVVWHAGLGGLAA